MENNQSKNIKLLLLIVITGLGCAICEGGMSKMNEKTHQNNSDIANPQENIKEKFINLYSEWQSYINKPDVRVSSKSQDYINCQPYRDIVCLGKPVLPFIIEKINEGKLTNWKEAQFFLWYAIRDITGVDLTGQSKIISDQEIAEKYIAWWNKKHVKK